MKAKKLYTAIILTMLLTSSFMALYKIFPANAAATERITNGSFEEFYINWTGTGKVTDYPHTGSFSLLLGPGDWMQSDNLGNVPVEDITSFGFYYIYCETLNFTIIFSDGSNVTDELYYVYDWTYVNLTSYLESGKNVSSIHFVNTHPYTLVYIDDVSLIADGVEKVPNGGFEDTIIPGWHGNAVISKEYAHSGSCSVVLPSNAYLVSDNLGDIPIKMVQSFGFYYYATDYYYCGSVKFTIIYSDGSNTTGTYSPYSTGWKYVNLTSYLPWDTPDKKISAIQLERYPYPSGNFWIDDVSLMAYESWYEVRHTISRFDFDVEAPYLNFTFAANLYVDSLNQTLDTEMRIIQIYEESTATVNVYLYVNSSGVYIHAVGGTVGEEPMGSGYALISLKEWHTVYFEFLCYEDESESWSFQVDDNEVFFGTASGWACSYYGIELGAWGAPDSASNYTLYYDDISWTMGYEDFEGEFPGDWLVFGDVGLSTSHYVSPTHSLQVPLPGGMPLSVSVTPETVTINRNATQTFEAVASGGSPPYNYKWYVNGTMQGETSSTFNFRTENLGVYEIWCNVTDYHGTEAKSNVAICNVESISLEVTISPSIVSINLGEYENVTASVIGGTPPLQYQWYRNGTAIGTNSSRYEINATEWGVGVWTLHCNVTDSLNVENKSNIINVYISEGILTVTISPSGTINSYKGLKTDFSSSVSGGIPPYTYEWYVDDQLKASTRTYTLIHEAATTYNVILKVYDSGINSQWSNTATVVAANPTVSLTPTKKSMQLGQSAVFTCIATEGMGNYIFSWYKNGSLIYQSAPTTNNTNRYTYTPDYSEQTGIYNFQVNVTFNTTYIEPFSVLSNNHTIYLFGMIKRVPAIVDRLTTSGAELPLGASSQKSAFSAHGYYWQFYYDGFCYDRYGTGNLFETGYLRYKYSVDTQLWVEASGSPLSGSAILNNIPFWCPTLSPAVYHGWAGGAPFTLYYDRQTDTLYVVYSSGTFTGSRSLKMVKATFNEVAGDWDWGTPETIATYGSPRLPVCPSLILADNGNPFVAFALSSGRSSNIVTYHEMYAYYNGTTWCVYPPGDPTEWRSDVGPKKLSKFGNKIYVTCYGAVGFAAVFDTVTQTFVAEETGQMMVPQTPEIWEYANFTDDVYIEVKASLDSNWIRGEYWVLLHLDVYNGSYWFTDVATHDFPPLKGWSFSLGPGTYTFGQYLTDYLQTDYEIANSRIRFWVTCHPGVRGTVTVDSVCYKLENSFDYVIETIPVVNYTESHDVGRTWATLHVNGYTHAESNWTKVGAYPYLNGADDDSYITTTTSGAVDYGYTFEDLDFAGGVVHGAYLHLYYTGINSFVNVEIYDGSSWHFAYTFPYYTTGKASAWIDVTGILDTFYKVNSAQLKFVHGTGETITIDFAELVIDYDYVEFPDNWVTNGNPPYLDAEDDNNVSVIVTAPQIYLMDKGITLSMPVPNMISYFTLAQPAHSVNASYPFYIWYYNVRDVAFQDSPNGYLSAFLVARTAQTLIREDEGFTNMHYRHYCFGDWEDEGEWWNYTLWYMNLSTNINNVFDAKAVGVRLGQSSLHCFWNDTLGDYQYYWVVQTDGLYWGTALATSLTLDGTPLCFHYYDKSMYVTRYSGYGWNILKFLDENSTILRMNYGEDRCFSYVIQTSSYDVKFFMPFVRVTVKAQTTDGTPLEGVGLLMNGELIYTPYNNSYDVIGLYSITLYPEHVYFEQDGVRYAFLYYIVEASPERQYNTAYFEIDVTGDITITIVYGVGGARIPSEITPTPPEEITYCLPLIFYILMLLIFIFGLYLYSRRETWKVSIPLILTVLWLIIFEPKTPVDQMPIAVLRYFVVPPWHLYMAVILTIIACAALLTKK